MDKAKYVFEKLGNSQNNSPAVGLVATGVGAGLISRNYSRGNLTGRETLYHATETKNVKPILNEGILASKSSAPGSITDTVLNDIPLEKRKNLVYMGRKKSVAKSVKDTARLNDIFKNILSGEPVRKFSILKANAPVWKMSLVDNPELRGAKNRGDFARTFSENATKKNPILSKGFTKFLGYTSYGSLSRKGTHTIKGDVSPTYLKDSAKYVKNSLPEIKQFIKANPKRFMKGILGSTVGAGLLAFGGKRLGDSYVKKK